MGKCAGKRAGDPAKTGLRASILIFGWLLALLLPSFASARGVLWGPADASAAAEPDEASAPSKPALPQVIPAASELESEVERALEELESLATSSDLETKLARMRAQLEEYRRDLSGGRENLVATGRVSAVRGAAQLLEADVAELMTQLGQRIEEIQALERVWQAKRDLWKELAEENRKARRKAGQSGAEAKTLQPHYQTAIEATRTVLEQVPVAVTHLLQAQAKASKLRTEIEALISRSEDLLSTERLDRWKRDGDPMWSPSYWAELGPATWQDAGVAVAQAADLEIPYFGRMGWVIGLHLLAFLVAWLGLRRYRSSTDSHDWKQLLQHPVALSGFATTVVALQVYAPMPPAWALVVWSIVASTGATLAWPTLSDSLERSLVGVLAFAYPLLATVQSVALPGPLMRAILVVVCLFTGILAFWWARPRAGNTPGRRKIFRLLLRVVGTLLMVAAITQISGFETLSRYLARSTLVSSFLCLAILVVLRLVRATMHGLVEARSKGHTRLWRRIAAHLGSRASWLIQGVLLFWLAASVLGEWGVVGSPLDTWIAFKEWGIDILDVRITPFRVLLATLCVYLAAQVSWVIAVSLDESMFNRGDWDPGIATSIKTLVHYALIGIGVLIALGALGLGLQNLAIIAGALGVGIGFGLQNVASDFVSGLILLFERPLRAGDAITLDGQWGMVRKIGLRSTTVTLVDQSEMVVPNSHLTNEKLINWTLSNKQGRVFCPVGVAYGSDIGKVIETLQTIAKESDLVLQMPEPEVLFMQFGESALLFELRCWVAQSDMRLSIRSHLLREIDQRFRKAGITIAFPQRDLHLRSVDPEALQTLARWQRLGNSGGASEPPREASTSEKSPAERDFTDAGREGRG